MRFTYCPDCGKKLIMREIGDEGEIPFCETCNKPLFDMFSSCVIVLVSDGKDKVVLLRQNYISRDYYNLVSGYIKPKERAEECARREVEEEIGLKVDELEFVGTYWFDKKDMLMTAFIATTKDRDIKLSKEVDEAYWEDAKVALGKVHPEGSVSYTLVKKFGEKGAF
ncbi:MAG: NUDIX domain-containing protein [Clostridia bacterium]|nr:NUDIX domain-containing protein [Clostridia bacterium]MDE7329149.1 NUDIX domain-containing protein [Clostridia bacterium]